MNRILIAFMALILSGVEAAAQKNITIKLVETSDVHGSFFLTISLRVNPKRGQWQGFLLM